MVEHGVDGYKALPDHVESLAWHVSDLLLQPQLGHRMAEAAFRKLEERYLLERIAEGVAGEYRKLTHEQTPALAGSV